MTVIQPAKTAGVEYGICYCEDGSHDWRLIRTSPALRWTEEGAQREAERIKRRYRREVHLLRREWATTTTPWATTPANEDVGELGTEGS